MSDEILRKKLIRLAYQHPSIRPVIIGLLEGKESRIKTAKGEAAFADLGLNAVAAGKGMGAMLYLVRAELNQSKFYEMLVIEKPDGSAVLHQKWGRLSATGTPAAGTTKNLPFDTVADAMATLNQIYRAKTQKGYVDVFGPKHKDPVTGRKLPTGKYPLGLSR